MEYRSTLLILVLLAIILLLNGCSAKVNRVTVFYNASDPQILKLNGTYCSQSGITVESNRQRIFYSDCDVILERELNERELRLWGK